MRREFLNQSRNFGGAKTTFSHFSGTGADFDSAPVQGSEDGEIGFVSMWSALLRLLPNS